MPQDSIASNFMSYINYKVLNFTYSEYCFNNTDVQDSWRDVDLHSMGTLYRNHTAAMANGIVQIWKVFAQ